MAMVQKNRTGPDQGPVVIRFEPEPAANGPAGGAVAEVIGIASTLGLASRAMAIACSGNTPKKRISPTLSASVTRVRPPAALGTGASSGRGRMNISITTYR